MAISRANIGKEIKMAGKKRVGLKRGGQPKKKKTKDLYNKNFDFAKECQHFY